MNLKNLLVTFTKQGKTLMNIKEWSLYKRCKIKEGGKFRFMKAKTLLKFYDQRTINDQLRIILQEQY